MKSKLIYKFIAAFIIAALVGFLAVSFLVSKITFSHAIKTEANKLYQKATSIASDYGSRYFSNPDGRAGLYEELDALHKYLECDIMLLSSDGEVLIDTGQTGAAEINDFDPADTDNGYYIKGDFHGIYDEEQITGILSCRIPVYGTRIHNHQQAVRRYKSVRKRPVQL